jgi:hypothetical protein
LFDEILAFWKGFLFSCQSVFASCAAIPEIFSALSRTARYSPTFARQPKRLIPFIKTKKS